MAIRSNPGIGNTLPGMRSARKISFMRAAMSDWAAESHLLAAVTRDLPEQIAANGLIAVASESCQWSCSSNVLD